MCNPFVSFTCDTNYLVWVFQGVLGWSLGYSAIFCFSALLLVWSIHALWGHLAGYTQIRPGLTLRDKEHNRTAEQQGSELNYYMKAAVVIVLITSLISYLAGQIWG